MGNLIGIASRVCKSAALVAALFTSAHFVSAATLGWPDGVNVQAGFFNGADKGNIPIGWELMSCYSKIGTVRIEIPPDQDVRVETMKRWISDANSYGYNVIVTYHRYQDNGSSDPEALFAAARWWKQHYCELSKAGPFTINLMNEWGGHSLMPEVYADSYNKAISIVREVYSGPIIIDIPGWGQETVTAFEASSLIEDDNIVFSVHIYSSAFIERGPHRWMKPQDLVDFSRVGRPIIIGEFGGMREGGADWAALTDKARELGWTVIAWAWNGDGEGMNMVLPSWNDDWNPKAYYPSTYFADAYARIGSSGDANMQLSVKDAIRLGPWESAYTFAIHSDGSWVVESDCDWIVGMAPIDGWGTSQIDFIALENKCPSRREATITVRCGDIVRSFPVYQDPWETHSQGENERVAAASASEE